MLRPATTFLVIAGLVGLACGSNGHFSEDDFAAHSEVEKQASLRIRHWVAEAEKLLDDPDVPDADKSRLRDSIVATRAALSRYSRLRKRGHMREAILSPIRISAGGIVADNATGIGIGDDVLLIPLALVAIGTYAMTDAPASRDELGLAWNDTLRYAGALGLLVTTILQMTAPGNVADTGIMDEVHDMIRTRGWRQTKKDICGALAILAQAAKAAKDAKKGRRIRATQKFYQCVPSRHSRE